MTKYYVAIPNGLVLAQDQLCEQLLEQINQLELSEGIQFFRSEDKGQSYLALQHKEEGRAHYMLVVAVALNSDYVLTSIERAQPRIYGLNDLSTPASLIETDLEAIYVNGLKIEFEAKPRSSTPFCEASLSNASTLSGDRMSPEKDFANREVLSDFDFTVGE